MQAQLKTLEWENSSGHRFPLEHAKVVSLSAILCGDPGSYKSEAVRLINKVLDAYNELVLLRIPQDQVPIPIYPFDKVSNEFLLSCLAQQSVGQPEGSPTISTIIVEEAINFLNKRDYVEPLIGTLNSLVDQPPKYATGTQKRQGEFIKRPVVSILLACAPGWFKHLPEAVFSGGWTGRCMFYNVPYPKDEDRQPLGKAIESGGAGRLAEVMYHFPKDPIILSYESIRIYEKWEREFGRHKAHPLPAIDEWLKRRAIMAVRFASAVALSNYETRVTPRYMEEADFHMRHIQVTLESVWDQIDSDDTTRYNALVQLLRGRILTEEELLNLAVARMKSTQRAMGILSYMKMNGILVAPEFGKWKLNTAKPK
jgi:hypothetical protein